MPFGRARTSSTARRIRSGLIEPETSFPLAATEAFRGERAQVGRGRLAVLGQHAAEGSGLVLVPEPGQIDDAVVNRHGVAEGVTRRGAVDLVGDGGNVFIPEVPRSVQLSGDLGGDLLPRHVAGEAELCQPVGDEVVVGRRGAQGRDLVGMAEGFEFAAGGNAFGRRGVGLMCSCPLVCGRLWIRTCFCFNTPETVSVSIPGQASGR